MKKNNLHPPHKTLQNLLKFYQSEKYDDAEKLGISITEKYPSHEFSWKVLASILRQRGKIFESLAFIKKALEINPKDPDSHNNLGNTLNDLGRLEEAEKSYRKAINLKPDYADAYNNLANTLNALQRFNEAKESYLQAIAFKPDFYQAHYSLGLLLFEATEYEKAIEHFKVSNFKDSKYFLLKCFYRMDKKSLFYSHLDYFINKGDIEPILGSLVCRSELRYGIKRPNLFCNDPLDYIIKKDLNKDYDFEKIFVNPIKTILKNSNITSKGQGLLVNGYQTSGNLFNIETTLMDKITKIIGLEVEKYRLCFEDSKEGLISKWPKEYNLYGWLICMKNGGKLFPHMHERGWLSGSIYINVPPKSNSDSGNLVVCIDDEEYDAKEKNLKKSMDVLTGSLCLFPSSLLHYTIPFESNEERIVLAFDLIPSI